MAAIGGMPIPSVNLYIDGYRNGAQCANPDVTVAVSYTYSFGNPAQELIIQGNDVIFGIAGSTGNGAILTTTQSGMWAIGVGFDQYVHTFENGTVPGADKLLTSAL